MYEINTQAVGIIPIVVITEEIYAHKITKLFIGNGPISLAP